MLINNVNQCGIDEVTVIKIQWHNANSENIQLAAFEKTLTFQTFFHILWTVDFAENYYASVLR